MSNEVKITVKADDAAAKAALAGLGQGMVAAEAKGKMAADAITSVGASVGAFAKQAIAAGDEILSTSRKMGVSTDSLQEMRFWADQAGVGQAGLERAVATLNQRIGEATSGNEQYAAAFEDLGVKVTDAGGQLRSTELVMKDTITSLRAIEDPAARAAAASELFGTRMARELLPALDASEMSMDEAARRAHELGIVMDEEAVKAADEFADSLSALQQSGSAILRDFIMPMAQGIADHALPALTKIATTFRALPEPIQQSVGVIGALSVGFLILAPRIMAAKAAFDAMGVSARTAAVRAGGIVAVFTALAAASALLGDKVGPAEANVSNLAEDLQRLAESGRLTGEILEITDRNTGNFAETLTRAEVASHGFAGRLKDIFTNPTGTQNSITQAQGDIEDLDAALAEIALSGGDADAAFRALVTSQGLNAEQTAILLDLLPQYREAQERANERTQDAAAAGDAAATAWQDAAESLQTFSDLIRAQTDPVFAWAQATRDAWEKQRDLNAAIEEYGENSPQARNAALDLAEAQIKVFEAEGQLTGSSGELIGALQQMRDDGHLSEVAFRALRDRIRDAERAAENADGTRVRFYEDHYISTFNQGITQQFGANASTITKAAGGIVGQAAGGGPRSNMVLVGEQGPEIVHLPPGSDVETAGATQAMLAGAGAGVVEVRFISDGNTSDRAGSFIKYVVENALRVDGAFRESVREALR